MAIIYDTTMSPGKLELLTAWLPGQPWYLDRGRAPELARAGGFRLDDPQGEVGIEFMVVTDGSVTYLVPMTYRGRPSGHHNSLIGTSEHGVLGRRWIYDGPHDPVLVIQLIALIQGEAEPQAQSVSHAPDPTVTGHPVSAGPVTTTGPAVAVDGPWGTELRIPTDGGPLLVRINRILEPGAASQPGLSAPWRQPDGTQVRGVFATALAANRVSG